MLILHLALYDERLGCEFAAMFVTFLGISYFASQIRVNKKKLTKFRYFYETTMYEIPDFKLT